jgi:regulator of RNase E activity RraA
VSRKVKGWCEDIHLDGNCGKSYAAEDLGLLAVSAGDAVTVVDGGVRALDAAADPDLPLYSGEGGGANF